MLSTREDYINNLVDFTSNTEKSIKEVVNSFGWTFQGTFDKQEERIICPFDEAHAVSGSFVEKHLESCQWKAEGYSKNDKPFPTSFWPNNSTSSIQIDEQLMEEIISKAKEQNPGLIIGKGNRLMPQTSDRLLSDFTKDERRVLYDHVVANTVMPKVEEDLLEANIQNLNKEDGSKGNPFLEDLALQRDLKRRRVKHRGVHTNKKSHSEVIREVIEQQTDMFAEYVRQINSRTLGKDPDERKHHSSDNSRDRDASRTRDSSYSRNEHAHRHKSKHKKEEKRRSGERSRDRNGRDEKWGNYQDFNKHEENSHRRYHDKDRNDYYNDHSRKRSHKKHKSKRYSEERDEKRHRSRESHHSSSKKRKRDKSRH